MSLSQVCLPQLVRWRNPWEEESYSQRQFRKATAEAGFLGAALIATIETVGCGVIAELIHFYHSDTSLERWLFRQSKLGMESLATSLIALIANPFSQTITLEKTETCFRIILDGNSIDFCHTGIKGAQFTALLKELLNPLENRDELFEMIKNNEDVIYEPVMFMLFFHYYQTRTPFEGLSLAATEEIDQIPYVSIPLKPHEIFILKMESRLNSLKEHQELFNRIGKLTTAEIYGPLAKEYLPMAAKKMQ